MATIPQLIDVLVVEDVDVMRDLLGLVLKGIRGVRVSGLAANVWAARREILRQRPHLVLLDEILPGESSLDLLADLNNQQIPVFLLTEMENPSHTIPAGAQGRLVKPGWHSLEEDRIRFGSVIQALFEGFSK